MLCCDLADWWATKTCCTSVLYFTVIATITIVLNLYQRTAMQVVSALVIFCSLICTICISFNQHYCTAAWVQLSITFVIILAVQEWKDVVVQAGLNLVGGKLPPQNFGLLQTFKNNNIGFNTSDVNGRCEGAHHLECTGASCL